MSLFVKLKRLMNSKYASYIFFFFLLLVPLINTFLDVDQEDSLFILFILDMFIYFLYQLVYHFDNYDLKIKKLYYKTRSELGEDADKYLELHSTALIPLTLDSIIQFICLLTISLIFFWVFILIINNCINIILIKLPFPWLSINYYFQLIQIELQISVILLYFVVIHLNNGFFKIKNWFFGKMKDTNSIAFRGILYWLIFIILTIIFSFNGLLQFLYNLVNHSFGSLIPINILLFFLSTLLIILIIVVAFIFTNYAYWSLIKFQVGIKMEKDLHLLLLPANVLKVLDSHLDVILAVLFLLFFVPYESVIAYFINANPINTFFIGFYTKFGIICFFLSLYCIFWLFFRAEDIIRAINLLKIDVRKKRGSSITLSLLTENKFLDAEVKKSFSEEETDHNKNILDWRAEPIKKLQLLMDGLDGFLIGSLPMMIIAMAFFTISTSIINFNWNTGGIDMDIFPIILGYISFYALIITLIYQSARRKLLNKIKGELRETYEKDCLDLAEKLDFYLDRPDFLTSFIIIAIPIFTFIIRYLPIILDLLQKAV